jgi:hypothetical protein
VEGYDEVMAVRLVGRIQGSSPSSLRTHELVITRQAMLLSPRSCHGSKF